MTLIQCSDFVFGLLKSASRFILVFGMRAYEISRESGGDARSFVICAGILAMYIIVYRFVRYFYVGRYALALPPVIVNRDPAIVRSSTEVLSGRPMYLEERKHPKCVLLLYSILSGVDGQASHLLGMMTVFVVGSAKYLAIPRHVFNLTGARINKRGIAGCDEVVCVGPNGPTKVIKFKDLLVIAAYDNRLDLVVLQPLNQSFWSITGATGLPIADRRMSGFAMITVRGRASRIKPNVPHDTYIDQEHIENVDGKNCPVTYYVTDSDRWFRSMGNVLTTLTHNTDPITPATYESWPGCSGSPVLASVNGQVKILGMHLGGMFTASNGYVNRFLALTYVKNFIARKTNVTSLLTNESTNYTVAADAAEAFRQAQERLEDFAAQYPSLDDDDDASSEDSFETKYYLYDDFDLDQRLKNREDDDDRHARSDSEQHGDSYGRGDLYIPYQSFDEAAKPRKFRAQKGTLFTKEGSVDRNAGKRTQLPQKQPAAPVAEREDFPPAREVANPRPALAQEPRPDLGLNGTSPTPNKGGKQPEKRSEPGSAESQCGKSKPLMKEDSPGISSETSKPSNVDSKELAPLTGDTDKQSRRQISNSPNDTGRKAMKPIRQMNPAELCEAMREDVEQRRSAARARLLKLVSANSSGNTSKEKKSKKDQKTSN